MRDTPTQRPPRAFVLGGLAVSTATESQRGRVLRDRPGLERGIAAAAEGVCLIGAAGASLRKILKNSLQPLSRCTNPQSPVKADSAHPGSSRQPFLAFAGALRSTMSNIELRGTARVHTHRLPAIAPPAVSRTQEPNTLHDPPGWPPPPRRPAIVGRCWGIRFRPARFRIDQDDCLSGHRGCHTAVHEPSPLIDPVNRPRGPYLSTQAQKVIDTVGCFEGRPARARLLQSKPRRAMVGPQPGQPHERRVRACVDAGVA